jgi:hypothetical protein
LRSWNTVSALCGAVSRVCDPGSEKTSPIPRILLHFDYVLVGARYDRLAWTQEDTEPLNFRHMDRDGYSWVPGSKLWEDEEGGTFPPDDAAVMAIATSASGPMRYRVALEKGSRTSPHSVSCSEINISKGTDGLLGGTSSFWIRVEKQTVSDFASWGKDRVNPSVEEGPRT